MKTLLIQVAIALPRDGNFLDQIARVIDHAIGQPWKASNNGNGHGNKLWNRANRLVLDLS